jgi:ATP-dependent helicase/nuclease subunit A
MPDADLRPLALALIENSGLEIEAVEPLLETVERARHSEIWKRAQESGQPLVEAPFVRLASDENAEEVQKIVRGVIDLAFREEGGWVLVDYKSDRAGEDAEKAEEILYGRYAAQLAAYAKAWEEVTGETVIERGLLLTHYDRYVVV